MERAAAFANPAGNVTEHLPEPDPSMKPSRACRGLLTFEFPDDHAALCPEPADAPGGLRVLEAPQTSEDSKTDDSAQTDPVKVPAEVEIYLGKEIPGTSRDMDWEGTVLAKEESSSEEETTETSKDQKRKKLDSGIGEGTTASSSSSPAKSESAACESDGDVITLSDLESDPNLAGGRGRMKRSRTTGSESSSDGSASAAGARRCKRRALARRHARAAAGLRPSRRGGPDARRVRLSVLMKRGVKELPLPYALKKYVNLGRCFEF